MPASVMKAYVIEAIYRKPNMSKPTPGHKIYPYLLRKMQVIHPDGTWFRLSRRRSRLVQPQGSQPSSVDHHGSRLLYRGLGRSSRPPWQAGDLQGSQFTSTVFTDVLLKADTAISAPCGVRSAQMWEFPIVRNRLRRTVVRTDR
jgi:putative transposase